MPYRFQVLVETRPGGGLPPKKEWKDVHPTGGRPYEYETHDEAENMARMCYGIEAEWRVREVTP